MTTVFNLVILDESGSMGHVTDATINGCNEVLQTAKNSAIKNAGKQRQLMSIYAFQSGGSRPSRYIVKNEDPAKVNEITRKDYEPSGCTPLLDAVGSTLAELLTVAKTHEDSTGIVTIITDGYENASHNYTWGQVADLISQAKELGWSVNIIGANIDLEAMRNQLHVDNAMNWEQNQAGTNKMFTNFCASMSMHSDILAEEDISMPKAERLERRIRQSKTFFKK